MTKTNEEIIEKVLKEEYVLTRTYLEKALSLKEKEIQKIGEEIEKYKLFIRGDENIKFNPKQRKYIRKDLNRIKKEISKIINNQIQDASNRKKEGEEVNSKVGHPDIPIKAVKGLISALDDVKYGRYEVISSGSDDICENIIKTIEKRKDKQHIGTLVRIHNYCKKILKQKKEKIE